jgi:hypothetical protein
VSKPAKKPLCKCGDEYTKHDKRGCNAWSDPTMLIVCGCRKYRPRAPKPKPFQRWDHKSGLITFDGYAFDDEKAWRTALRQIVSALNAARVVLKS